MKYRLFFKPSDRDDSRYNRNDGDKVSVKLILWRSTRRRSNRRRVDVELRLKPNTHSRRRRDATVESRLQCVLNSQVAHDFCFCRQIRSTIWKLNVNFEIHYVNFDQFNIDNFFSNEVIMCHLSPTSIAQQHKKIVN